MTAWAASVPEAAHRFWVGSQPSVSASTAKIILPPVLGGPFTGFTRSGVVSAEPPPAEPPLLLLDPHAAANTLISATSAMGRSQRAERDVAPERAEARLVMEHPPGESDRPIDTAPMTTSPMTIDTLGHAMLTCGNHRRA